MASTQIVRHIRNYSSAGTLSAIAGVVTFPILTRNLTIEEYGILGLVMGTLTLFVAVGKLGLQHAIIRFYAQIVHGDSEWSRTHMYTTVLAAVGVLAVLTTVVWIVSGPLIVLGPARESDNKALFVVASGTVFLRLFGSALLNFMRAGELSGKVAKVQIINRYLYIAVLVLVLLLSGLSPIKVLACTLLAEIVALIVTLRYSKERISLSKTGFKSNLVSAMLVYGLPLMVLEILGVFLRLCDRYLISYMMGDVDLGMYSASYNLTSYLDMIILATLAQALRPTYMKLWEQEGLDSTRQFLSSTFYIYLAFGIPVVAIFSATAPHLLNFLASPKFAPGTVIIPFVTISFLLQGAVHWLAAGLYVQKNTRALMFWSLVAALANIALNIWVIPRYGILGVSAVTVISFLIFVVGISISASAYISLHLKWVKPALISLMSGLVYAMLINLDFGSDLPDLLMKGAVGSVFCLVGLYVIDPRLFDQLVGLINARRGGTR